MRNTTILQSPWIQVVSSERRHGENMTSLLFIEENLKNSHVTTVDKICSIFNETEHTCTQIPWPYVWYKRYCWKLSVQYVCILDILTIYKLTYRFCDFMQANGTKVIWKTSKPLWKSGGLSRNLLYTDVFREIHPRNFQRPLKKVNKWPWSSCL